MHEEADEYLHTLLSAAIHGHKLVNALRVLSQGKELWCPKDLWSGKPIRHGGKDKGICPYQRSICALFSCISSNKMNISSIKTYILINTEALLWLV
jgi:hypothetical protein